MVVLSIIIIILYSDHQREQIKVYCTFSPSVNWLVPTIIYSTSKMYSYVWSKIAISLHYKYYGRVFFLYNYVQ